jgi:hypothetical protein
MYSSELPNFNNLNIKMLKKIASLQNVYYNVPKPVLIKKLYEKYNEIMMDKSKEKKECPICLDTIHNTDTCTTKCNHTFHLSCLLKSNDNTCPICRAIIPNKSKTIEYDCITRIGAYDENEDITANNMIYSIMSNTEGMLSYS